MSEYPTWSELTHVQLALEPTAWTADSYFQGNRQWQRQQHFHVQIEEELRMVSDLRPEKREWGASSQTIQV